MKFTTTPVGNGYDVLATVNSTIVYEAHIRPIGTESWAVVAYVAGGEYLLGAESTTSLFTAFVIAGKMIAERIGRHA